MKILKLTALVFTLILIAGCRKSRNCGECEKAILSYTPNCATINGYVELESNNEILVFKHKLKKRFRKTELPVCIRYKNKGQTLQTSECYNGDEIDIRCIELQ